VPGGSASSRKRGKRGALPDRLGESRRRQLADRLMSLSSIAERLHGVEEVHLVPRSRSVEPGLSTAVASWTRGADLSTVLAVAARDCGEVAPGDFVRVVKQVADLAEQIAHVEGGSPLARAAAEALPLLVRSVVAGGPEVSASPRPAPL
jgi:ATP-dependent RNA helicase HelY